MKQFHAVSTPLPSANGRCHRYRVEMATERTAMQPHLLSRLRQVGFCSQLFFFVDMKLYKVVPLSQVDL